MLEWIRFCVFTFLILVALILETMAVIGVNRFRYSLNRIHSAGIGDTLAIFCVALAAIVFTGFEWLSLKFVFLIFLMWMTSPISGHLVSLLVYRTDENLEKEAKPWRS